MGFLRNLFKGKAKPVQPAEHPVETHPEAEPPQVTEPRAVEKSTVAASVPNAKVDADGQAGVNIWDFDGPDEEGGEGPVAPSEPEADLPPPPQTPPKEPTSKQPVRGRRNKTRIIGFESSNSDVVSLFDAPENGDKSGPAIVPSDLSEPAEDQDDLALPLGWLVVVDGPGRGRAVTLCDLNTTLGRGDAPSIGLDFGDTEISEGTHASIAFAADVFTLTPGEDQVVSVNDATVETANKIATGDMIRLGATTLRFVALCNEEFGWAETEAKETTNVATA